MKLSISSDFFPPDLSEAGREKAVKQFFGQLPSEGDDWFRELGRVTLWGKLGMVITWFCDGYEDLELLRDGPRLTKLVPALLGGRYARLTQNDLFVFRDALSSFKHRDELLNRVYVVVDREWSSRIRRDTDRPADGRPKLLSPGEPSDDENAAVQEMLSELEADAWDAAFESDVAAGRLDELGQAALAALKAGKTSEAPRRQAAGHQSIAPLRDGEA